METGEVKMFDRAKNFGFIIMDDGEELFFHTGDIDQPGKTQLNPGDRVKFDIKDDYKGSKAIRIKKI